MRRVSSRTNSPLKMRLRPHEMSDVSIEKSATIATAPRGVLGTPDSAFIGFFAQGKLKKIARTGGPAQTLCDAPQGQGGFEADAAVAV